MQLVKLHFTLIRARVGNARRDSADILNKLPQYPKLYQGFAFNETEN